MKKLLLTLLFALPLFGQVPSNTSKIPLSFAYDQDAQLLFQRMTTPPTETRKKLIDQTIKELKSFGIWYQLDVLYLFAAHAEQPATLNWIKNAHNATLVNSPTFTVDRGLTGDGATSYANSNYNPASQGIKYQLASVSGGAYIATNQAGTDIELGGVSSATAAFVFEVRTATDMARLRIHNGNVIEVANTDSRGFFVGNQLGTARVFYRNGAVIVSGTQTPNAVPDLNIFMLAFNNSGTPSTFSDRQTSAAFLGGSLSASQHYHFNRIIEAYMDAIGAGVQ